MKATKLVSLAIPILLLVGCEIGDKDSSLKTEETSKAMLKTVVSEKQYPYYICEQLVEFQFKSDEIMLKLAEAPKDNKKYKDVFKTAEDMDEALDRIENIEVPDKYKDIHKLVQEGVTDARKGTKMIKDAGKEDGQKIQVAVLESAPHMSGVDGEQWREAIYRLNQETKDAYSKALDKKMEEHTK
ncbi:hypothetical protein [Priestia taiwanensis]|uniref:Uncharacterized protein n=1 Tax=Priestia taiwanensis TaxID=1347902 RepID=A0A917AQW9_9BACI|nr:hypothetical protein [Priestia taiwanensis]MBM7362589.1 hypothetical protein [Priestia taiwanensis]GGE63451.1 hypothetical protein GCM10007140_12150 [Priestia taiwanensis]